MTELNKEPFVKTSRFVYLSRLAKSLCTVDASIEERLAAKECSVKIEDWWKEQARGLIFKMYGVDILKEESLGFTFTFERLNTSPHGEFTVNQFAAHGMMPDKPVRVFNINKGDILTR